MPHLSERPPVLQCLPEGAALPPPHEAWGADTPAPGLLCAGADLSVPTLAQAYSQTIFPWFSAGQPILWWSPDPRMVLDVSQFHLRTSLKKRLKQFSHASNCQIRVDSDFEAVINACAHSSREGQTGTWIVPAMVKAYTELHRAGLAHSVETWIDGQLQGGLYFVALGRAVFGESMFHDRTDCSKIALAALVAMSRKHGVTHIDCQQYTPHLASLGAKERPRQWLVQHVAQACQQASPTWAFTPVYWSSLLETDIDAS